MIEAGTANKVWKIEEVGDCSIVLISSRNHFGTSIITPNPNMCDLSDYYKNEENILTKIKECIHTPETLVVYFEDKVPFWAKVGMEVLIW